MQNRIERLMQALESLGADGAIFHSVEDVCYYSGFDNDSIAIVGPKAKILVANALYFEAAQRVAVGFDVRSYYGASLADVMKNAVKDAGITRLAYQEGKIVHASFMSLESWLDGVEFIPMGNLGQTIREIKDEDEIAKLKEACRITDCLFWELTKILKPGVTELDAAVELHYIMQKKYHAGMSFDTIIASGINGSLPHAVPGDRVMEYGDLVTVDFGACWQGYHADMTRTFALGEPSAKMREIYDIVLEAQLAGVAVLRPGITGFEADKASRDVIAAAGYGEQFVHTLGHGVGLEIHERPNLSYRAQDQILVPGHCVTVEPGIYLPGVGGVRIEDTCLITKDGCEVLFEAPKQLQIIA